MPSAPPWVSLTPDPRGERAFTYMPDPNGQGKELCLYGAPLVAVDSMLAVALRATIERYCQAMPVRLNAPADPAACAELLYALGEGLPPGLQVKDLPDRLQTAPQSRILLPATSVPGFIEADDLTDQLPTKLAGFVGSRLAGFLAASAATLLENALQHQIAAEIDPLVAISHDPETGMARVAVADTGSGIESDVEADQRLAEALERSQERDGGLVELVAQAKTLGIEVLITIASGAGRLRWNGDDWYPTEEAYVGGTSAIIDASLTD